MTRAPIIDTTTTVSPVLNPFGADANAAGWYIETRCPIHGRDVLPLPPFDSEAAARAAIAELL